MNGSSLAEDLQKRIDQLESERTKLLTEIQQNQLKLSQLQIEQEEQTTLITKVQRDKEALDQYVNTVLNPKCAKYEAMIKQLQRQVDDCEKTHLAEIERLTAELRRLHNITSAQEEIEEQVQCGVGMQVELHDDGLIYVRFVNPGGAADAAGHIEAGDILHRVDGKPMKSTDAVFDAILGRSGTAVELDVEKVRQKWRGTIKLVRKVSPTAPALGSKLEFDAGPRAEKPSHPWRGAMGDSNSGSFRHTPTSSFRASGRNLDLDS